jgi:antitoxin component YwqK of YwqJK toxin-antitoxin module
MGCSIFREPRLGTTVALIAAVLALCAAAPGSAQTRYYRSNALGMEFDPITSGSEAGRDRGVGFVLEVTPKDAGETRVLRENGAEVKRWEIASGEDGLTRIAAFDDGEPVSVEYYDGRGRLTAEERYFHGEYTERAEYAYRDGAVVSSSVTDADGVPLYRDLYSRTSDGRLRQIIREYPDGTRRRSSYGFSGEVLLEEYYDHAGTELVIRYDREGNILSREEWEGEKLLSRENFTYTAGKVASSRVDRSDGGATIDRTYSDDGLLILERTREGEKVVRTTEYAYVNGRLSTKKTTAPGLAEELRYVYADDGSVAEERYLKNGSLEKLTVHTSSDEYYEELYKTGELFMRVTYLGGQKTTEEFIRDGKVIRTRSAVSREGN